jgi:hypothetical protein
MRAFLCAAAILAWSLPADAETWVEIANTASFVATIDSDSAERTPGHVRYWMRQVLSSEHPIGIYGGKEMKGENIQGVAKYTEMRSHLEIDCDAHTYTQLAAKFYDRAGAVVSEATMADRAPKPIGPKSLLAAGADLLCKSP